MLDNYYAVIMAGGGGTRLWPLSASPAKTIVTHY
jgi:mannose-1-phosphate guanylyltransferase